MSPKIMPGHANPLGATPTADGTNFAVSSGGDEVSLCLFDADGVEARLVLPERDGDTRHGFVPGVIPGQAYGFRVSARRRAGPRSGRRPATARQTERLRLMLHANE